MEQTNYKQVQTVLFVILIANLVVAVMKMIVGSIINSASMTADGFHSLSDGSSNIIGLVGIKLAAKPVDEDHPYGHKKFETLASLFICVMLFAVAGKVIIDAIDKMRNPVLSEITFSSLLVMILTLLINLLVTTIEYKRGKKLQSQILISDSMHTRSDIYVSVGVLGTLLGVKLGLPPILDPIVSLVVSGFIIHAGYEIFKESRNILVDRSVVDVEKVTNLIMEFNQVKGVHKIRSRGTQNHVHIDLHLLVDPTMTVAESHDLEHQIENAVRESIYPNAEVIAHIEPYRMKDYDLM
ncbi:cation diffusion facilitator family transporter [Niallia oryzisoli]|uniref:cation diffusion facilitator family transporter n=1 Tax=Niallia oryzisoli TaxID=1737571 RepID=UPI003736B408